MMTSAEIRQQFLDFFESKGHTIVPSAPIVIKNDPTLLFTNAGMNQFKEFFLGDKTPPYGRVADTQKCLRVSGKHNDLEEVGVDTYHHTMFEMLGNWSFGDYFKKEAISWSWELLTEVYKIPKDRLYATVFEGDKKEGLPASVIALQKWKEFLPEDHIVHGNKKDNFWEMGDTGPCGPCSEIHVDCRSDEERKKIPGKDLVNKDHPQVIEIWNNVFIQFNRKKDGTLEPLASTHVDTGMGLERLVRVLQGKSSNYDTDIFTGTIEATGKLVKKVYKGDDSKESIAFRVIADHIRAISFTIADGQLPSNTGAGYVIRRILRRAVRYYYSYLDYKQPLLHKLLPVLAKQFENVFPELNEQLDFVSKVVKEEEDAFLRTVDKGLSMLNEASRDISGEEAFKLYDTFGFPLDLTKLVANEKGLNVDEKGFEIEMKKQKDRSRAATTLDTEDWIAVLSGVEGSGVEGSGVEGTDAGSVERSRNNGFVGYDSLETRSRVIKYRKVTAKGKALYQIILDSTPFYAESGGQVGDSGSLSFGEGRGEVRITDTKKENDLIIHFAESIAADMSGEVIAKVDAARRKHITVHHSVTHLMHAALRNVLGTHVAQKGSLVNEEHLRFDFSHFAKMKDEEITAVEKSVNEKIRENIPVVIKLMPKEEAMKLGAMALFGEKYGDVVRVVIMDPGYSVELCGGTHVGSTGELGLFKIKSEGAVAAGVRRIEAVCGTAAEEYVSVQLEQIRVIRDLLKNPADLNKSVENLLAENSAQQKRIESLEARQLVGIRNELMQKDEIIDNVSFIGDIIEVPNADSLKKLCFDIKHHVHDHLAVLCSNIDGKAHVAISISDTVVAAKNLDAGKIIKEHVAALIKGGGGGQKNLATAGGQDASNLKGVIEKVRSLLG
ncbi:MAG: alanine--tRNA ligase [Ferruginibacter sp.]|nr:alanine--tRNA ligase [Ferruginibacter sp.]MBU9936518.1 alanine--tRNA ligase [Ferruginibacter sp.]